MVYYRIRVEPNGSFTAELICEQGDALLVSGGHQTLESAQRVVDRCRSHGTTESNYQRTFGSERLHGYILSDSQGMEIADGPSHIAEHDRDANLMLCLCCANTTLIELPQHNDASTSLADTPDRG